MMRGMGCMLKCRGEESDRNRTKHCRLLERNAVSFFWYKGKLLPANTSTCQWDRTYVYLRVWVGTRMHTRGCESGLCSVLLMLCEQYFFSLRNGSSMGVAFDTVKTGPGFAYFPAFSLSMGENVHVNFGATPLRYPCQVQTECLFCWREKEGRVAGKAVVGVGGVG